MLLITLLDDNGAKTSIIVSYLRKPHICNNTNNFWSDESLSVPQEGQRKPYIQECPKSMCWIKWLVMTIFMYFHFFNKILAVLKTTPQSWGDTDRLPCTSRDNWRAHRVLLCMCVKRTCRCDLGAGHASIETFQCCSITHTHLKKNVQAVKCPLMAGMLH
jgi:hypothetical protein